MPRDSSGTYAPPSGNPVGSGTTVESAWANNLVDDVGAELTSSLDRAGRGAMTDQFKAVAGTISAPGITWAVDLNTGWYRAGDGDTRFSLDGVDLWEFTAGYNQSNVRIRIERALPGLDFYETDGAADEKQWSFQMESGDLVLRARDDNGSNGDIFCTFLRGTGDASGNFSLPNGIELGHATDTTITRSSAGNIAVEGNQVYHAGNMTLASGTYTPTIAEVTNGGSFSAATSGVFNYIRVGSMVMVTGEISVTWSSPNDISFSLTLPIASNFANDYEASGTVSVYRFGVTTTDDEFIIGGGIRAITAADTVEVFAKSTTLDVHTVSVSFMYQVI